jgi:hypothetical protein
VDAWAEQKGNLSPAAARARLRVAVAVLAIALVAAIAMAKLAVPWYWRLALFLPFFLATNSFLQGLYRT